MTNEIKKNAKNAAFFYKECKRMQRTPYSFIKNAKERRILLKRTQRTPVSFIKNAKERNTVMLRSFEKKACTLHNPGFWLLLRK